MNVSLKRMARLTGALLGLVLSAPGCGIMPPFPSLPTTSPSEIRQLDLIPHRDLGGLLAQGNSQLGFSNLERMTVRIRNIRCTGLGTGTGFAIDPFTIITNRHVLAGAESLVVSTFDGRDIAVMLPDVAMSDDADIAIIKVTEPLPAYVASRRGELYQDEPVTVIGFPEGGQLTITQGIVLGLTNDPQNEAMGSVILTDAQVLPGSSGSPMLDADGNLIGVIYARTDDNRGLAVRIELLDNLLTGAAATNPLVSCRT